MPNDMLSIRTRGLEEVRYLLQGFEGTRAAGVVTEGVATEIVAVMKEQPDETPYQYVSRASAYGAVSNDGAPDGYFSWRQFRFVMASLARGEIRIPYRRTGTVSGAWRVDGKLSKARAVNDNDSAPYVFGKASQSRHEEAVGWQKVPARLEQYGNRIFDAGYAALKKYIDSRRKK